MQTPEIPNECIDDRVEQIVDTEKSLNEADEAVSRASALEELVKLEEKSPEELLERMKEMAVAQREAKRNGESFMITYTNEVRAEAVELGINPTEYAGLRTKLDLSLEALG